MTFDWNGEQIRLHYCRRCKKFSFQETLHETIAPFAFRFYNQPDAGFNYMVAHIQWRQYKTHALATLEATWKKLNPYEPFEFSFLDLDFQKNYEADNRKQSSSTTLQ